MLVYVRKLAELTCKTKVVWQVDFFLSLSLSITLSRIVAVCNIGHHQVSRELQTY